MRRRTTDTLSGIPTSPQPDFDGDGAWIVAAYFVGRRYAEPIYLRVLIDCARQVFVAMELTAGEPGPHIGDWLNAVIPGPSTAIRRLYSDTKPNLLDREPIARDALVAWGQARGVDIVFDASCCWRAGMARAVWGELCLMLERYYRFALDNRPPDPVQFRRGLQTWLERYNRRVPNHAWIVYRAADAGGVRPVQMTS